MNQETASYEELLKTVNKFMLYGGCYFDEADKNRKVLKRFLDRPLFCFSLIMLTTHLMGDFSWLVYNYDKATLLQLTYFIPCVTLSLLALFKSILFVKNGDRVADVIKSIKTLQDMSLKSERKMEKEQEIKERIMFVTAFINVNSILYVIGLILFAITPLIMTWFMYNSSGKLEMQLPFLSEYPFDETDLRYWPMAYIHQIWAGVIDVSAVHGSDSFYSVSCTFLQTQFITLRYDIERIVPEAIDENTAQAYEEFRERFVPLMKRHKELIGCVNIVEEIYSKSNFFLLAVSSICICVSAFNLTTIDGILWKIIFLAFMMVWLLQVFSVCYYSNLLNLSSTQISDAVYNSLWYKANARVMKDLLFVLTRGQKPCKLTAWGFSDLNLRVFGKIVSSSWSYFALLQTMNKNT